MSRTPQKEVLDIEEASLRLGVSRASLYGYMRKGLLPYVKLGRRTLILPEDLDELLRRNRVQK